MELSDYRAQLDALDGELLSLFCRRMDIAAQIGAYKKEHGLPVLDLFAMGGIQPSIEAQKIAFCPDGLHPNDAGNRRIADRLIAFLRAY